MANLKRLIDAPQPAVTRISDYSHQASEVVRLFIVRDPRDMNDQNDQSQFEPNYTHQFFGDDEQIYGYTDLKIKIYFSASTLRAFIRAEYTEKAEDADDFMMQFDRLFFGGYTTDYRNFIDAVRQDDLYEPIGTVVHEFVGGGGGGGEKARADSVDAQITHREDQGDDFRVYRSDVSTDGFAEYRRRVWPLIVFSIETASFDADNDWPWVYYSLYKRGRSTGGKWALVAVITVTTFCFSVDAQRWRISQVLTLPPYQRRGYAQVLLYYVYGDILAREAKCLQICVEDPNEDFTLVRDIVETRLVLERGLFRRLLDGDGSDKRASLIATEAEFARVADLDDREVEAVKRELKLPYLQIQRLYDILLLSRIDTARADVFGAYRKRWIERIKKLEMPEYKRKVPYIVFDGRREKIDVAMITDLQNKAFQQDTYYDRLFDHTIAGFKVVMKKNALLRPSE